MPQGGSLRFHTDSLSVEPSTAQALGITPGDYHRIRVSDTGTGIDAQHLVRIFEPFYTTKALGSGSGLGLAMVYSAMHGAGGTIQVESQLGEGTTFTLWLPAARAAEDAVERTSATSLTQSLQVLLVDDDSLVLDATAATLRALGCRVTAMQDPREAVLAELEGLDVALLDGNMPGMTGWELARALRARRPVLPIVALTGAGIETAVAAWNDAGVTQLLYKPVSSEVLLEALRAARNQA